MVRSNLPEKVPSLTKKMNNLSSFELMSQTDAKHTTSGTYKEEDVTIVLAYIFNKFDFFYIKTIIMFRFIYNF